MHGQQDIEQRRGGAGVVHVVHIEAGLRQNQEQVEQHPGWIRFSARQPFREPDDGKNVQQCDRDKDQDPAFQAEESGPFHEEECGRAGEMQVLPERELVEGQTGRDVEIIVMRRKRPDVAGKNKLQYEQVDDDRDGEPFRFQINSPEARKGSDDR